MPTREEVQLEAIRAAMRPQPHEVDRFYGDFRMDLLRRMSQGRLTPSKTSTILRQAVGTFPAQSSIIDREADELNALAAKRRDAWLLDKGEIDRLRRAGKPKAADIECTADYSWRLFAPARRAIAEALEALGLTPFSAPSRDLARRLQDTIDQSKILREAAESGGMDHEAQAGEPGRAAEPDLGLDLSGTAENAPCEPPAIPATPAEEAS